DAGSGGFGGTGSWITTPCRYPSSGMVSLMTLMQPMNDTMANLSSLKMIDIGCSGRQTCCLGTRSPCISTGEEFPRTRLIQLFGGSQMSTHTSSVGTGTGVTTRRLGPQTATSPNQSADGARSLPPPEEPSSVMMEVLGCFQPLFWRSH
ncbi:hypothetical protein XENOCAPTIV_017680, partial [Xenoophorus captivus]